MQGLDLLVVEFVYKVILNLILSVITILFLNWGPNEQRSRSYEISILYGVLSVEIDSFL